jgi:hypothetical protein
VAGTLPIGLGGVLETGSAAVCQYGDCYTDLQDLVTR